MILYDIMELEETVEELCKTNGKYQEEIGSQKDQKRRLRETNNLQENQIRTLEYQLISRIERFRNEKDVEEYDEEDEIKDKESVWVQNGEMSIE
ncbi:hypothetical protein F8M41_015902 [Gigaspora margarita]|uniref:Uncharacterized protein n=1 Tax=Gigaspora margarita TaxID=4874 RepID=A0A8H3WTJ1_GIGMA|nr:hypothetical protein F8M41_015902 [Gigaspora margarita]